MYTLIIQCYCINLCIHLLFIIDQTTIAIGVHKARTIQDGGKYVHVGPDLIINAH